MTRSVAVIALFLGLLGTGVLAQTKGPFEFRDVQPGVP